MAVSWKDGLCVIEGDRLEKFWEEAFRSAEGAAERRDPTQGSEQWL